VEQREKWTAEQQNRAGKGYFARIYNTLYKGKQVWFGLVWFGLVWFGLLAPGDEMCCQSWRPAG
jgi:hypothetical protein